MSEEIKKTNRNTKGTTKKTGTTRSTATQKSTSASKSTAAGGTKKQGPQSVNMNGRRNSASRTAATKQAAEETRYPSVRRSAAAKKEHDTKRDDIIIIVVTLLCVLMILSYLGICGIVGTGINAFIFGLFGRLGYILPFIVLFFTLFFIANRDNGVSPLGVLYGFLLAAVLGGMIQLAVGGYKEEIGLWDYFGNSSLNYEGADATYGGLLGGMVVKLFCSLFGTVATVLILIALLMILFVLMTGKPFIMMVARKIKRRFAEYRRKRAIERNEQDLYEEYGEEEEVKPRHVRYGIRRMPQRRMGTIDVAFTKKGEIKADTEQDKKIQNTEPAEGKVKTSGRKTKEVPEKTNEKYADKTSEKKPATDSLYIPGVGNVRLGNYSDDVREEEYNDKDFEETGVKVSSTGSSRTGKETARRENPFEADKRVTSVGVMKLHSGSINRNDGSGSAKITGISRPVANDEHYEEFESEKNDVERNVSFSEPEEDFYTKVNVTPEDFLENDVQNSETNEHVSEPSTVEGYEGNYDSYSGREENDRDRERFYKDNAGGLGEIISISAVREAGSTQEESYSESSEYKNNIDAAKEDEPGREYEPGKGYDDAPEYSEKDSNGSDTNVISIKASSATTENRSKETEGRDANVTKIGSGAAVFSDMSKLAEEPKAPVMPEYKFPPLSFLKKGKSQQNSLSKKAELENTIAKLQSAFESFGVGVKVTDASVGPTVTRYEILPDQGVKVKTITSLSDDIKLALAAAEIRIEAPIPGKSAVGIEVPNKECAPVLFGDLIDSDEFRNSKTNLAFAVGKDIGGQSIVSDIGDMPHALIAGATGSGKSVCINALIMSILYKAKPTDVKMIMIDPKRVELVGYNGIPHLIVPVVTDVKKAAGALAWAVSEMDTRYKLFADAGVRDLAAYNSHMVEQWMEESNEGECPDKLPQIVIIVDELNDLMMTANSKDIESDIARLTQLARACGIHVILATQRPSVNVITGTIKANIPTRIAFAVSSIVDSRTILDQAGAEKLLGKGDMLYYPRGYAKPVRLQGVYVSDDEVNKVVKFIKEQYKEMKYNELVSSHIDANAAGKDAKGSDDSGAGEGNGDGRDQLFEKCGEFIIEKQKSSVGALQRVFKIGFNRAARIMDQLCEAGVVGPEEGTKARTILMSKEEFEAFINGQ